MKVIVKVIPRARTVSVEKLDDGSLKVKLRSAADKGKANKELIEVLSNHYGVRKKDVEITKGLTNTRKNVVIAGIP